MRIRRLHLPHERFLWVALAALIGLTAVLRFGPPRVVARLERGKNATGANDASRFAISFFQALRDNHAAAIPGHLGTGPTRLNVEYTLLCDMDVFVDAQTVCLREAESDGNDQNFSGTIYTSFGGELELNCKLSHQNNHWIISEISIAQPDAGSHLHDITGPIGEVNDIEGKQIAPQLTQLLSSTEFRQQVIDDCNFGGWISPDLLSHLYSVSSFNNGSATTIEIATQTPPDLKQEFVRGTYAAYALSEDISKRASLEVLARRLERSKLDERTRKRCAARLFVSGFDDISLPLLERCASNPRDPSSPLFAKIVAYMRDHPIPRGWSAALAAYRNVGFVDVTIPAPLQAHNAAVRLETLEKFKVLQIDPSKFPSEQPFSEERTKMLVHFGLNDDDGSH